MYSKWEDPNNNHAQGISLGASFISDVLWILIYISKSLFISFCIQCELSLNCWETLMLVGVFSLMYVIYVE